MGRTACTEPQCLYKGCTLPYFDFKNVISDVDNAPPPQGSLGGVSKPNE